jgi:tripartite-type tricarboxylate transporter receptor subunit TctC
MRKLSWMIPLSLLLPTGAAFAQAYPSKPVRIVIGFAAGGSVDLVGRTMAQKLGALYGRQVVVDNRPGASGHIAGNLVAKAEPDGHTLLVSSMGALGTNLALYTKMPYNPLEDLAPIALLVYQAQVVVLHPSVPARSVKELIALGRARPGQLRFGSAGSGGPSHMAVELFGHMAGVKMLHVPYKGGALSFIDLLGGQIDLNFQPMPDAIPHAKSGRLRFLAVTTAKRSASLPNLPTVAEAGLPGYAYSSWMGVAAPAGIPRELAARISGDFNKALEAADVQSRLLDVGLEVGGGTPEQFGTHIRQELAKMVKLVKDVGLPPVE